MRRGTTHRHDIDGVEDENNNAPNKAANQQSGGSRSKHVSIELPPELPTHRPIPKAARRATIGPCNNSKSMLDKQKRRNSMYSRGHRNSSFSGAPPKLRKNSVKYTNTPSRESAEKVLNIDEDYSAHASAALTVQQEKAFREAFDLFDSSGGGTIVAQDLKITLDSVGFILEEEEIHDIITALDIDGNGEIDFEEFLIMMTNTEMFLESIALTHEGIDDPTTSKLRRNTALLFNALSEFMKKSVLVDANEIVGYYATTYKRAVRSCNQNKGAHVVGHYADGAKLIGLTEKQLVKQLKKLIMAQKFENQREKDSPYAQPLQTSVLASIMSQPTNKARRKTITPKQDTKDTDKQNEPESDTNDTDKQNESESPTVKVSEAVDVSQQMLEQQSSIEEIGGIKLEIINNSTLIKETNAEDEETHTAKENEKSAKSQPKESVTRHKHEWNIMSNVEITLPIKYRHVQADNLKNLRCKVKEAKDKFFEDVAKKKIDRTLRHYKELNSRRIPTASMHQQFRRAFCTYSSAQANNRTAISIKQLKQIENENEKLRSG